MSTVASTIVTKRKRSRRTELVLLAATWVITASLYILASLGSHGAWPTNLTRFIGIMVGISLVLHVAIRFLAPSASQVLLPIATMLNGIGLVEIVRWNPPRASYQELWYAVSAVGAIAVLLIVRNARLLDRYPVSYTHLTLPTIYSV